MKTLIKNGLVVNSTGTGAADVLIDGETIAAVLAPGSTLLGFDLEANVDTVIDAAGKYVIPRSEERRVGKECTPVCRSRWSPYH